MEEHFTVAQIDSGMRDGYRSFPCQYYRGSQRIVGRQGTLEVGGGSARESPRYVNRVGSPEASICQVLELAEIAPVEAIHAGPALLPLIAPKSGFRDLGRSRAFTDHQGPADPFRFDGRADEIPFTADALYEVGSFKFHVRFAYRVARNVVSRTEQVNGWQVGTPLQFLVGDLLAEVVGQLQVFGLRGMVDNL